MSLELLRLVVTHVYAVAALALSGVCAYSRRGPSLWPEAFFILTNAVILLSLECPRPRRPPWKEVVFISVASLLTAALWCALAPCVAPHTLCVVTVSALFVLIVIRKRITLL